MINVLVNYTHPEIDYTVHQCARFFNYLKLSPREQATKISIRYLLGTIRNNNKRRYDNQGIIYR